MEGMTKHAPGVGEWTAILVGYGRKHPGSTAHRLGDDDRTVCGFGPVNGENRAVPAPPGLRRCTICALSEVA